MSQSQFTTLHVPNLPQLMQPSHKNTLAIIVIKSRSLAQAKNIVLIYDALTQPEVVAFGNVPETIVGYTTNEIAALNRLVLFPFYFHSLFAH